MGNATFTRSTGTRPQRVDLGRRQVSGTVTFSASYATGGDTLVMTTIPFDRVTDVIIEAGPDAPASPSGRAIKLAGTATTPLLQLWSAGSQAANASNQSTVAIPVRIIGY